MEGRLEMAPASSFRQNRGFEELPVTPNATRKPSKKKLTVMKESLLTHMRRKWMDWLVVIILTIIFPTIEFAADPFERYIPKAMEATLQYPHKEANTIPSWAVPVIGILVPFAVLILYACVSRNCDWREFHDLVLALLLVVTVTATITSALKESIGRPRPDFWDRCFPKGDVEFKSKGFPECDEKAMAAVVEGRKSFPSGHSSWTMCSLAFISFLMMGKLKAFNGEGQVWKFVVSLLPIAGAIAVGVTRINDYWHHWTDVVAGWSIGFFVALAIYMMYYPNPCARRRTEVPLYKLREEGLPLHQAEVRAADDSEGEILLG